MNEDVNVNVAPAAAAKVTLQLSKAIPNTIPDRTAAKDSRKLVNVDEDADIDPKDILSDSIILLIPQYLMENASKRRSVLKSATFQEVTQLVHETMDYEDAQLKPTLMHKTWGQTKSLAAHCLTEEEWYNLVDTLEICELKGQPPKLNIIVIEKYLTALALKLKGAANVNGKWGQVKSPPLNLDLEGPAHSVSDTDAVTEAFMKLRATHSHCAVCGPTKPCLVEGETHHELSMSKLKSWAHGLGVHTPMMTLSRPLHTEAFKVFFKKRNQLRMSLSPQYMQVHDTEGEGLLSVYFIVYKEQWWNKTMD
ncbi:hypothetical protein JB92DRAFT_3118249 [Gautieria morchelliformis]|nr:hypothetical protein JB92DRAFT_3118249 [Gautieria morchelliformis]